MVTLPGRVVALAVMMLLLIALVITVGVGLAAASPAPASPAAPAFVASGGGEHPLDVGDEMSEDTRRSIERELEATIAQLAAEGALPRTSEQVSLALPLRQAPGFNAPDFYGISSFVDHDPGYPGALLDYECGRRTYDNEYGYDHKGTDYFLWPFSWNMTNAGAVEVIAAAPGTIIGRVDGNPDRSCSMNSGTAWNAVYIRHDDGSIAWYGHMKRGSVTGKQVGMTVAAGEYLGLVGSSGLSTGPHLHFELYRSYQNLVDPYAGICNPTTSDSWWATQDPYVNPALMRLMTGAAVVEWKSCPNEDITHEADYFRPGDTVYFTSFYRDLRDLMTSTHRIYRPNGSLWHEWVHTNIRDYLRSYWWWSLTLEPNAPLGEWRYTITFQGATYEHKFYLVETLPTPTSATTATPSVTPTASTTPTPSATPTPSVTPTPSATPTQAPTPGPIVDWYYLPLLFD